MEEWIFGIGSGLALAGCCWLALTAPRLDDEDEDEDEDLEERDPGECE